MCYYLIQCETGCETSSKHIGYNRLTMCVESSRLLKNAIVSSRPLPPGKDRKAELNIGADIVEDILFAASAVSH